jgi:hypothetical protein
MHSQKLFTSFPRINPKSTIAFARKANLQKIIVINLQKQQTPKPEAQVADDEPPSAVKTEANSAN